MKLLGRGAFSEFIYKVANFTSYVVIGETKKVLPTFETRLWDVDYEIAVDVFGSAVTI